MSTYVISDIHGCYSAFMKLLEQINFSDDDELIIAGDIVDRGSETYEMLRYMEKQPHNVRFIIGNHDYDFMHYCQTLAYLSDHHQFIGSPLEFLEEDKYLFLTHIVDHYGTVKKLIKEHQPSVEDFKVWRDNFQNMPYYIRKRINNKNYTIVHAGYISPQKINQSMTRQSIGITERIWDIETFYIWARDIHWYYGGVQNGIIIFGHTPTISHSIYYNNGKVFDKINQRNRCRYINIDCGYVYKEHYPEANMAIFRLEDEKVIYLKK